MWSIEIKEAVHVFFVLSVLMDIIITELLFEYHTLKPQDSFGKFVLKKFLIFRKWTIPSESTIKPISNCFE